jgi:hypothetical protein
MVIVKVRAGDPASAAAPRSAAIRDKPSDIVDRIGHGTAVAAADP